MKKLLSFLVSIAMLAGTLPAFAAEKLNAKELYYYIDSPYLDAPLGISSLTGYNNTSSGFLADVNIGKLKPLILQGGKYKVHYYNVPYTNNYPTIEINVYNKDAELIGTKQIDHRVSSAADVDKSAGFYEVGEFDFPSGYGTYITFGYPGGSKPENADYVRYNCIKLEKTEDYDDYYKADFSDEDISRTLTERTLAVKEADIPQISESAVKIYVKNGANGDGSKENPFGSIEDARDYARGLIAKGYPTDGIGIYIHAGVYKISDTLTFTAEDSGTEEVPVIYRAYGDGEVTVTMADSFIGSDAELVTDNEILKKIPQNARGKLYSVDLKANGVSVPALEFNSRNEWQSINLPEKLIIDDVAYTVSKYPNAGEAQLGMLQNGKTRGSNEQKRNKGPAYSFANMPRMLLWGDEAYINAKGKFDIGYTAQSTLVSSVDTAGMVFGLLNAGGTYSQPNPTSEFYNILAETDMQGEFYFDRNEGRLYFYPIEGFNANSKIFLLTSKHSGIKFTQGASNIAFLDIDLKMTGLNGYEVEDDCKNVIIAGSQITHIGEIGVSISTGARKITVRDCDLYDVGTYGIQCTAGNYKTAEKGECVIENNSITGTGKSGSTTGAAIRLGYDCGNTVRYNHLYDLPYQGVLWGGFSTTIEYNLIERYNQATNDAGAIYCCSATCYGSVIRYNIIRDGQSDNGIGCRGIYFDDGTFAGTRVENNIFKNIGGTTMTGRDMYFTNNVFISDKYDGHDAMSMLLGSHITSTGGKIAPEGYWTDYDFDAIRATGEYSDFMNIIDNEWDNIVTRNKQFINNVFYCWDEKFIENFQKDAVTYAPYGAVDKGNVFINDTLPDKADFSDIDWDYLKSQNQDIKEIPVSQIGTYTGGLRTNTTDIYEENLPREFKILYPENGQKDVETDITFLTENLYKLGYKTPELYIAESEDFSRKLNIFPMTSGINIDLQLESGKTYYAKVGAQTLNYYGKRYSDTICFTTESDESILDSIIVEASTLIKDTVEGTAFGQYKKGSKKALKDAIEQIKESEANIDERISMAQKAFNDYKASQEQRNELATYIYNDMEGDIIGDRTLSFFVRNSIKDSDIWVEWEDEAAQNNKAVRLKSLQRGSNVPIFGETDFTPQDNYMEFYTSIKMESEGTAGAVNLCYPGLDTYVNFKMIDKFTPICVFFGKDGKIYSSLDKTYPSMKFNVGEWYDVAIKTDISERKYDVYINGDLLGADIPFYVQEDNMTIGRVIFSETEGTFTSRNTSKGAFLIDNIIVRGPAETGKNCYIYKMYINGEEVENFDISKNIYYADMTSEELEKAAITFEKDSSARVSIYDDNGVKYIAVLAGNQRDVHIYKINALK